MNSTMLEKVFADYTDVVQITDEDSQFIYTTNYMLKNGVTFQGFSGQHRTTEHGRWLRAMVEDGYSVVTEEVRNARFEALLISLRRKTA